MQYGAICIADLYILFMVLRKEQSFSFCIALLVPNTSIKANAEV